MAKFQNRAIFVRHIMVYSALHSHWPYYSTSLLLLFGVYCAEYHHKYFVIPFFIYTILPVADQIIPDDELNPTPEEAKILSKQFKWKVPIYTYLLVQWMVLIWSLTYVQRVSLNYLQLLGLVYTVGHSSSISFLYSHELFHKRSLFDQTVGTISMLNSLYMHFFVQHVQGHHKNIATPNDPATARYGQTLYAFVVQSVRGGMRDSWEIEEERLKRQGKSAWDPSNKLIWIYLTEILFVCLIKVAVGNVGTAMFLAQALYSVFMLETINYIRHYGLLRKEVKPGVFENVDYRHSWNAPQMLQNIFLLKLQRHSDHHESAYKEYQVLCSYKESPTLPGGYAVCVPLSMLPPCWFTVIDPLVMETNKMGKPSDLQLKKANHLLQIFIAAQASFFAVLNFLVQLCEQNLIGALALQMASLYTYQVRQQPLCKAKGFAIQ